MCLAGAYKVQKLLFKAGTCLTNAVFQQCDETLVKAQGSGYPHISCAAKYSYPNECLANKYSYQHNGHADKDSYPHDGCHFQLLIIVMSRHYSTFLMSVSRIVCNCLKVTFTRSNKNIQTVNTAFSDHLKIRKTSRHFSGDEDGDL